MSRFATASLVIIMLTGCWLIAAPFLLRFQQSGAPWTGATWMDVVLGGVLAVAGYLGLFVALGGWVREQYASRVQGL